MWSPGITGNSQKEMPRPAPSLGTDQEAVVATVPADIPPVRQFPQALRRPLDRCRSRYAQAVSPKEMQVMWLSSLVPSLKRSAQPNQEGRLRPQQTQPGRATKRLRFVPRLEALEDRTLLSTLTVLNTADSGPGSLRQAIATASPGDTIDFAPNLSGKTIVLTSGQLVVSKDLD